MKLLIIFDKDIRISPEKVCVHVGHSTREISKMLDNYLNPYIYSKWGNNQYKTVLLRDKITENIIFKIQENLYYYEIYDAGLDGVFAPGTVLGYAVLVKESDETFKRLRTLKF